MQKRSISNVLIILLIIAILSIVGYIGYSRYIKTLSGEGTGAVAKWSFKVNGQDSTIETIDLADTVTSGTSNLISGKLAPGTSGEMTFLIDGSGSEVGITYYVAIDITGKPTNLKFYEDSNYTNEIKVDANNTVKTSGVIELADVNIVATKKVYWKWAYETGTTANEIAENDKIDTGDSGKVVNLGVTITGVQSNTVAETTAESLASQVQVGDYVNYSASNNGTYAYTTDSSLTGSTDQSTFGSSDIMKWRVLSVNKTTGAVELMSADSTATTLTLSGKAGYKNAETVLNGIGAVYGHGKGAASGRSITAKDIEQYSSYDKTTYANNDGYRYGTTKSYTSGTFINADGSEVTASSSKPVTVMQTSYVYTAKDYYVNTMAYKILFMNEAESENKNYWLASQCVEICNSYCGFRINCIDEGDFYDDGSYYSDGDIAENACAVVPIVSLTSNIQTSGKDENGAWNLVVQ